MPSGAESPLLVLFLAALLSLFYLPSRLVMQTTPVCLVRRSLALFRAVMLLLRLLTPSR